MLYISCFIVKGSKCRHFISVSALFLTAPHWCVAWLMVTVQNYRLLYCMLRLWENPVESPQILQHHSPSSHCMSVSQRAANAHTPASWETGRLKISIVWKNTYGYCRNEYDLLQVVWVCLKRSAHFKNRSIIWFVLLETILQSHLFYFLLRIGRSSTDTQGNSKPVSGFVCRWNPKGTAVLTTV